MEALAKEGVNSFKFFLAYKGALAVAEEDLLAGLKRSKELGALPMVRCPAARTPALVVKSWNHTDRSFRAKSSALPMHLG